MGDEDKNKKKSTKDERDKPDAENEPSSEEPTTRWEWSRDQPDTQTGSSEPKKSQVRFEQGEEKPPHEGHEAGGAARQSQVEEGDQISSRKSEQGGERRLTDRKSRTASGHWGWTWSREHPDIKIQTEFDHSRHFDHDDTISWEEVERLHRERLEQERLKEEAEEQEREKARLEKEAAEAALKPSKLTLLKQRQSEARIRREEKDRERAELQKQKQEEHRQKEQAILAQRKLEAEQKSKALLEKKRLEAEQKESKRVKFEEDRKEKVRLAVLDKQKAEAVAKEKEKERVEAERRHIEVSSQHKLEAEQKRRATIELPEKERSKVLQKDKEKEVHSKHKLEEEHKEKQKTLLQKLKSEAEQKEKVKLDAAQREKEQAELVEKKKREDAQKEKAKAEEKEKARIEKQRFEAEQKAKEKALLEKQKLEAEQKEKALLEKQKLDAEQKAKETAQLGKQNLEAEQKEKALLEQQKLEAEQKEKALLERQKLEAEQEEKALLERQKLEAEQEEKALLEKQKLEAEQKEKALLENQKLEAEQKEKERLAIIEKQQKLKAARSLASIAIEESVEELDTGEKERLLVLEKQKKVAARSLAHIAIEESLEELDVGDEEDEEEVVVTEKPKEKPPVIPPAKVEKPPPEPKPVIPAVQKPQKAAPSKVTYVTPPFPTSSEAGYTTDASTAYDSDATEGSTTDDSEWLTTFVRKYRSVTVTDLDDDDELTALTSADDRSMASRSSKLHISDEWKSPDDTMLFSLTKREELVYRRSIKEMKWEEQQSLLEHQYDSTTDSTDTEAETAAALLWQRVGPARPKAPPILVNDQRISLGYLDAKMDSKPAVNEGDDVAESYKTIFQEASRRDSTESDDPAQVIYDLIDESSKRKRESVQNETKTAQIRSRMWRRRLIVVILLNFLMRFRRKFLTFNELILPVLISVVLLVGMVVNSEITLEADDSQMLESGAHQTIGQFEESSIHSILYQFCSNVEYCGAKSDRYYYIVYSPKNKFTEHLMSETIDFLKIKDAPRGQGGNKPDEELSQLIGVNSSLEVERLCREHWNSYIPPDEDDIVVDHTDTTARDQKLIRYPMGIIFSFDGGILSGERMRDIRNGSIPKKLSFTIRTFYPEVSNTVEGFPFREQKTDPEQPQSDPYLNTGIIGMQFAIDFAYAKLVVEKGKRDGENVITVTGKNDKTYLERRRLWDQFATQPSLKKFEYPTYKGPEQRVRGWVAITMVFFLSFVVCDICVAQEIVIEQQRGSIELLKIHGMTTSMRWIANLMITAILRGLTMMPIVAALYILLARSAVSNQYSPVSVWYFFWLNSINATCFNYFIITGFGIKKPELAGMIVVTVGFLTGLLPLHLFVQGYITRVANIILCVLFPQWNLANGIYYYLRYEIYEEGLNWYDFPSVIDSDTHRILPLTMGFTASLYSILLYVSLTIYMDHILPREFSPKESWLFCFQSYTRKPPWMGSSTRPIPKAQKPSVYEHGPRDAASGPRFRNVTLTEGINKTTVLDNISLDIYEGEVTCIVGQIGSGKSDLLNVIAGVNVPSAGFVDVKGLRVHEYHDITNKYVSLCPQKSLLMETLSVEDHIRLCCMLHGASYGKAKTQAAFLLKMFGLTSMRRHNYKGLTMSDTKKLMVAMALSKSPSILLLDNPIDQLDSESSLEFWKLLQELKPQRTIIVTCTKLEEAELYGDRIAVLSKGKLVCYGTPHYIKLAYGLGSIMSLRMAPDAEADIEEMERLMNRQLNGAKVKLLETKGKNDSVKFILPYGKFCSGLIEKLEDNMERLQIAKINMSQPSLWALYHRIAAHSGIESVLARREARMLTGVDSDENLELEAATLPPIPVKSEKGGRVGLLTTISILVRKKIWYYRQMYWTTMVAFACQIILVLQLVYFAKLFLSHEPESLAKLISTRMYSNNYVYVRAADNEKTREGWEEAYKYVLKEDDRNIKIQILGYKDDINRHLAAGSLHTLTNYKKQTIVAFSRDVSAHTGYYSSNSIHSAAVASHILMQAFIYLVSPDRVNPYSTAMSSHPFIQYPGFPASSTQSISSTILGLFLALILSLLSCPSLRLILAERTTRFKMIQRMAGVSSFMYWVSHGIADYLLYAIITALCCGTVFFFDTNGYLKFQGWNGQATLVYITAVWLCWAAIPYTYFISSIIPIRLTGYGVYVLNLFVFGIIPQIVVYQFFRLSLNDFVNFMRYALYIFPPYSLTSACVHYFHILGDEQWCTRADKFTCDMYTNLTNHLAGLDEKEFLKQKGNLSGLIHYTNNQINFNDSFRTCCRKYCELAGTCHPELHFFPSWNETAIPGLTHDMTALVANGFLYWFLVILVEKRILQGFYGFISTKLCGNLEKTVAQRDVKTTEEPEDVKNEHQKVDFMVEIEGNVDSEVFLVQDVTKFYPYTKGLDHVYFSVPVDTITGILGLPKTGKSTLMEVLTAQMLPSGGYVYKDNDLLESTSRKHLMQNVGYCPQKSCLLPHLTASQILTVMGKLRGLTSTECMQHTQWWLQLFGLEDLANKKCSMLRRGQDRRLCCALALIGDTSVIIMDEPTALMDNLEKYFFWNVLARISSATSLKRTFLFTSTDAEEVQQQSSKVVVIDSGAIVAVGQLNDIFKNNNQGMLLAIRYRVSQYKKYSEYQIKSKIDKLKDHVIQYLSPCALTDEQENLFIYHLKDQTLKLSRVFAVMEGAKVRFPSILEDFQVFEQTLDEVILQLHKARYRRQEELTTVVLPPTSSASATDISSRVTTA